MLKVETISNKTKKIKGRLKKRNCRLAAIPFRRGVGTGIQGIS
jgi:hypothetical protein